MTLTIGVVAEQLEDDRPDSDEAEEILRDVFWREMDAGTMHDEVEVDVTAVVEVKE